MPTARSKRHRGEGSIYQRRPRCRKCGSTDVHLYEEIGATATFFDVTIDERGDLVTTDDGSSDGPPRYIRSYLSCRCGHMWRTKRAVHNEPG